MEAKKSDKINLIVMSEPGTYVATVNVRDDFFNDPFFKDWWSEFEGPVKVLDTPGNI